MKLLKRLKNLWFLSQFEDSDQIIIKQNNGRVVEMVKTEKNLPLGVAVFEKKMATIVEDTPEPFEDLLDNQEENGKDTQ